MVAHYVIVGAAVTVDVVVKIQLEVLHGAPHPRLRIFFHLVAMHAKLVHRPAIAVAKEIGAEVDNSHPCRPDFGHDRSAPHDSAKPSEHDPTDEDPHNA